LRRSRPILATHRGEPIQLRAVEERAAMTLGVNRSVTDAIAD